MTANQQHKKICLSGDENCTVVLCPTCNIVELNLGAATVRIHPESLQAINAILLNASQQLARMQHSSQSAPMLKLVRGKNVH